jgi:hypothetical protein
VLSLPGTYSLAGDACTIFCLQKLHISSVLVSRLESKVPVSIDFSSISPFLHVGHNIDHIDEDAMQCIKVKGKFPIRSYSL